MVVETIVMNTEGDLFQNYAEITEMTSVTTYLRLESDTMSMRRTQQATPEIGLLLGCNSSGKRVTAEAREQRLI